LSAAAISILLAAPEDLLIDNMLSDSSDDDNDAFDENFIDDEILHDSPNASKFSFPIYIYFSLTLHQREDFVQGLPFFGTIFRDINISSMESVADAKLLQMPFFMGGPEPKYKIKKTYAVEQVYHDIMGQYEGTYDLMRCRRIRHFPLSGLFSTPFTRASHPS
jgi:hypothetical protein